MWYATEGSFFSFRVTCISAKEIKIIRESRRPRYRPVAYHRKELDLRVPVNDKGRRRSILRSCINESFVAVTNSRREKKNRSPTSSLEGGNARRIAIVTVYEHQENALMRTHAPINPRLADGRHSEGSLASPNDIL